MALKGYRGIKDRIGMAKNLHIPPDLPDYTLVVDQERSAVHAHIDAAV